MEKLSLNSSRKTIQVDIPSIKGAWIKLYTNLTVGDLEEVSGKEMTIGKMVEILRMLCIDWNLTEELTLENLKLLPVDDINEILNATDFIKKSQKTAEQQEDEDLEKKTISA